MSAFFHFCRPLLVLCYFKLYNASLLTSRLYTDFELSNIDIGYFDCLTARNKNRDCKTFWLYNKCWGVRQIELTKIKNNNKKESKFVQNPL